MKRIIITGMAWMMMLVTVQPTLAFHFCGGMLTSVGAVASGCCCGSEVDGDPCAAQESFPVGERLFAPVESCCADYAVTFSADDCTIPPCVSCGGEHICVGTLFAAHLEPAVCRGYVPVWVRRLFPPDCLPPGGTTLLTLICTFRL